ncbi:hypothetical protein K505DRAFT_320436 [Melanomma pulvis-pyrius CBS 109.77]|uniref:Uncharacterized protein n=1 Tax=Melanomma pulvis-pyrius CBS 109.77 TaxID=1314802 RepID=A0A6A6XVI1_9PLEO|nr:hypothetical protein K505DRAFT_320436 [Melanomma pulvis-pyrius CBS 109.77]
MAPNVCLLVSCLRRFTCCHPLDSHLPHFQHSNSTRRPISSPSPNTYTTRPT